MAVSKSESREIPPDSYSIQQPTAVLSPKSPITPLWRYRSQIPYPLLLLAPYTLLFGCLDTQGSEAVTTHVLFFSAVHLGAVHSQWRFCTGPSQVSRLFGPRRITVIHKDGGLQGSFRLGPNRYQYYGPIFLILVLVLLKDHIPHLYLNNMILVLV